MASRDSDPRLDESAPAVAGGDAPDSDADAGAPGENEPANDADASASDGGDSASDGEPPAPDGDAPPPDEPPPPDHDPAAPRLPREVVRAYLARPETVRWVHDFVKPRVPEQSARDVASASLERCVRSPWVPSTEAGLPGWVMTLTERQIADFFKAKTRRDEHEVPMPARAEAAARHGADGPDPGDDVLDDDERDELAASGADDGSEAAARTAWMARRVAGHARDRETFEMMREWSRGKTYKQIAQERGILLSEVNNRVSRFKAKYGPRWKKHQERERIILLWRQRVAKGGWWAAIALAIAVLVAAFVLQRRQRTDRDLVDAGVEPHPSPPPGPAPFDQAHPAPTAPTGPQPPPAKPRPAPKPRAKPPLAPETPPK